MNKKKTLFMVPLLVVTGLLLYCWTTIVTGGYLATWRHYVGLLLFPLIILLFFKDLTKAIIALGVFLLLATFNILAVTPAMSTNWAVIGGVKTPSVQPLSLGILVLYFILNMDTLIDIQLDYKEAKLKRQKHS